MESNSIEELRKKIKIRDGRKILYLSGHSLEELPVAVMELIELEELYLTNNKLKTIPENIRKLINLTRLDLYGNQLSIFPASLSQLKKLKWLDISWNEWLTTDAIGEMEELEILFLKENQLTVLSSSITQLKKLKELYITGNKLTTIPDAIGEMVGLEVLELNYNKLTELSPAIKQLKKLKVLSISQNQLTTIPDSIGEMVDLEKLDLSHNQLTVLSSNIKQLKKLEWLKISYNKLTTVPNAIGEMVNLKTLNLSYNQLSVLPSSAIKQLKKLESLYVDGNPTFTAEGMRSVMELEDKIDRVYSAIPDYVERLRPEGREVELAYERALKDGYVEVYRGRIMLIGQERAGKTSLKKSLLGLPFDPEEQSTEGIIVDPSKCEIDVNQVRNWQSTNKNKPVLLEHGKGIADILLGDMLRRQGKDAEDSTRKEEDSEESSVEDSSDDEAEAEEDKGGENFQDSKEENSPNEPEVQIDSSPPDDIMKYLHQGLEYVKCRGDINREVFLSLDMWDFAGQHLYYASHPIFLSSRALYVLVHNLSKPLDALAEPCVRQGTVDIRLENSNNETNIENLLSWLATVHSVAQAPVTDDTDNDAQHKLPYLRPPVFIVGTHADKPVDDIAVMKKQIKERISGKEYEKHVVRPLYCIDNTRSSLKEPDNEINADNSCGDAIHLLQNRIMEVLRKEPYMGEKIPIRWFLFEKVIEALVAKRIYHRNLQQLELYARKECFMNDVKEFNSMISFYHGLGMIIKHRSTVVLKAQWLIKLFKQLITVRPFDKVDPLYTKYWQELEGSGILSMEHVDHVFSSFIDPMQGIDKEDILGMMEQFGLIAKFSVSPNNLKYFVPAQLKSSPDKLLKLKPSLTDPCPVYLFFMHGFVPHGLFLQLVSRSIRFCAETWPHMAQPTLYENGARFIVGKNSHHFALICKTGFIKIILRQLKQSHQVVKQNTAELATVIREFLEATLQALPQELPYLRRLQYRLCVACPYCYQGTEEPLKACSDHIKTTCTHKDCFHLIDANEGNPTICSRDIWDEERTISGLEKWFLRGTRQGSRCSNVTAKSQGAAAGVNLMKSDVALKVTLLGSEWSSSMGGLSTINRQLAILLGKHSQVDVTLLVPQFACSEEERRMASRHNVSLREAQRRPGYTDPLDWLSAPPRDLAIDIVLGHGAKLGKQAQIIRESHQCGWIQVVHTVPEELGMHKNYAMAICKGEEKNTTEVELCELADVVVAVGPKLTKAYSSYLRSCEKHQEIIQLTPSTFSEFSDVKQAAIDMEKFKVLTFGRGDPEDFSLKGYDISARAIVELRDRSCHLIFVGAPDGKQDEVAEDLLESGIDKGQLTVRKFVQSKERLKKLFCEVDLCMMPSRTEGFGLTALEALSAGLPILVSGNSGFGEALSTVPSGKSFVVESEDPKEWAKAIAGVREKERSDRLHEIQQLKTSYEEMYSWEKQCDILVEKMRNLILNFRPATLFENGFPEQIIQELQQMQRDASRVRNRTDLLLGLRKIASDKGFRISDNPGSGNCMFYALSEQLEIVKGIKIPHDRLRQTLVQYLRSNLKLLDGTDLLHFVDGHQTWTEYLTHMEQDGTWGDHVILCAAANYYETFIRVVSSLAHSREVIIKPHCPVDESQPLVLGHIHEVHYVSLLPSHDYVEIQRAEGHEAELAYERTLKDEYVRVYHGRIMLIGQYRAGKTSLKKSLLGLPFDPKEQSTDGIEVDPSKCEIDVDQVRNWQSTDENKPGLLECAKDVAEIVAEKLVRRQGKDEEDSSGEEECSDDKAEAEEDKGSENYQDSEKQNSPNGPEAEAEEDKGSENFQDSEEQNSPNGPEIQIDTSPPDEIIKYVHQWLEYIKRRGDINREVILSLDMWDFAGQHLYYASHPIFLSSRALYILVHNLSKPLDTLAEPCVRQGTTDVKLENCNNETNIENLLSWLATVHSVAQAPVTDDTDNDAQHKLPYLRPPVFIVGTHADKPVDDIAVIKKQIKERISGKEYEKHVVRPLYCIDNTRSSSKQPDNEINADNFCGDAIPLLQNSIMEVLRKEPYMEEKIPIRWFLFEKVIEALLAKQIYHRSVQQLEHYARKECFMKDPDEFDSMISFYHDLGKIIKHRSTVVLKAQWLIELFKQLITVPHFDKVKEPLYAKYWQELEESGILSMKLVDHVFSSFTGQGIVKEDILGMMEQFGLIAKFSDSSNNLKYFVPAQLKSSPDELLKLRPSSTDPCPLYLHFVHGFVPHGLFLQLVSRSIRWCSKTWAEHQPTLHQNVVWFIIGKDIHDFVLICEKRYVKVVLRQRAQSHQVLGQNSAELAILVREFLEKTLQALQQELPYLRGLQYELCVACPYCHQGTEEPLYACIKTTCIHKDCFHLIDANEGQPTICKRKLSDKVMACCGLEKWFSRRSQESAPLSEVCSSHSPSPGGNSLKEGVPSKDELEEIAYKIGKKWIKLGRRLKVEDAMLEVITDKYNELDERAYHMLKHWQQEKGSEATYQVLNDALQDKLVQRKDLAEQYCYNQGHTEKRRIEDDSFPRQKEETSKRLKGD